MMGTKSTLENKEQQMMKLNSSNVELLKFDTIQTEKWLPEYNADLQYFYIEPESHRMKKIKQKHIALALQGGGCKGVTYIGAYKAILDHYKHE